MKPLHELDNNLDDDYDHKYYIRVPGLDPFWGNITRAPDKDCPLWCFWHIAEESCIWTNHPVTILDDKVWNITPPTAKEAAPHEQANRSD